MEHQTEQSDNNRAADPEMNPAKARSVIATVFDIPTDAAWCPPHRISGCHDPAA